MAKAEGIPPTASTASTGLGINYVGDWVFAYAGLFDSSTSEFEMLNFTTGAGIIFGEFTLNGSILFTADVHLGGNTGYKIEFNGEEISTVKADTTGDNPVPVSLTQKVIIPPFTKVVLTCVGGENSATERVSAYLTGRVYDA